MSANETDGVSATPEDYKLEFLKQRQHKFSNEVKKLNKVIGDHSTSIKYHDNLNRLASRAIDELKKIANEHYYKLEYLRGEYFKLIIFAIGNALATFILAILIYTK